MRFPSPDLLRLSALSAGIGPLVAAFLIWDSSAPGLSALGQKPLVALALSIFTGVTSVLLIRYSVEKPLTALMRRRRIHVAWITLIAAIASVVILLLLCGILIVAFGLPSSGKEAVRTLGAIAGFVGFTVLGATSIDGLIRSTNARRELLAARSQARALESQISPHFFFNTLNTISALIPEDPEAAQRCVHQLAGLFRHSLENADDALIPLERELLFVRQYLEIERARFGDRLRFSLPEPHSADGLSIPRLTLQPLVENAIRHGIAPIIEGGEVTTSLTLQPHSYILEVSNPVEGRIPPESGFFAKGHALHMVRERLRLLYRDAAELSVHAAPGIVSLRLLIPSKPTKEQPCGR